MLMPSWKKAQKVFTKISIHRLQQSLESNVPRQWNQSPTGSCASCAQLDILSATEVGGSPTPVHTWAHIENVFYTHGRTWANPETARDKGGNPVAGNNTGDRSLRLVANKLSQTQNHKYCTTGSWVYMKPTNPASPEQNVDCQGLWHGKMGGYQLEGTTCKSQNDILGIFCTARWLW